MSTTHPRNEPHHLRHLAIAAVLAGCCLGFVTVPADGTMRASAKTTKSPKTTKSTKTTKTTNTAKPAVDPNAPEVLSPGDIPDNIAFVPYRPASGGFRLATPEGWSRRIIATGAVFTDKYNIIQVESFTGRTAPTLASATVTVTLTMAKSQGFKLGEASTVKRKAGSAVLVTYFVNSAPNAVTGKTLPVAVERYEFFRDGTSVVLTLSGAKGADNVDPWKTVTDSFRWV